MPLNPLAAAAKQKLKEQAIDLVKGYIEESIKYCTVGVLDGAINGVPGKDILIQEVKEALDQPGADRLLPALVINALTLYKYPPPIRMKLARSTVAVVSLVVWVEYCKFHGLNTRTGALEAGGSGIDPASILKTAFNLWDNAVLAGTVWTLQADWDGREKELVEWQALAAKALTNGEDPPWPVIRGIKLSMYFGTEKGGAAGHPMHCK